MHRRYLAGEVFAIGNQPASGTWITLNARTQAQPCSSTAEGARDRRGRLARPRRAFRPATRGSWATVAPTAQQPGSAARLAEGNVRVAVHCPPHRGNRSRRSLRRRVGPKRARLTGVGGRGERISDRELNHLWRHRPPSRLYNKEPRVAV